MTTAKAPVAKPRSRAKNPSKLTGPEKIRFLSVLEKDPELQRDVIRSLHEMGAFPAAARSALLDHVPDGFKTAAARAGAAAEAAKDKVDKIAHDDRAKKATDFVQEGAAKARSAIAKRRD